VSTRSSNDETLSLLIKNYHVSGWAGSRVAGRSASVVEASPAWSGASAPSLIGGGLSARWWIDDKTGLLLWQETYDAAGSLVLSSGFTQVTIGGASDFNAHLPPQMAVSTTTAVLTLSNARALSDLGWACQDELAGLSLIRLRGDAAANPDVLLLVYSDGVSTLTVFEQHGRLTGAPAGAHWDRALGAYVRPGTPTMATWQSGGTVLTVATDGSEDLMATAVGSLPHQASHSRTTMDRVRAGWLRILHLVIG
jgi:negative regulator of sigma E activity